MLFLSPLPQYSWRWLLLRRFVVGVQRGVKLDLLSLFLFYINNNNNERDYPRACRKIDSSGL
jgi:hypothetical protein